MKQIKRSLAAFLLAVLLLNVGCSSADIGGRGPSNIPAVPTAKAATLSAAQSSVFTDVPADSWYAQAAAWCQENGIMGGTSDTTFDPDITMTRAMLATILHRVKGSPVVNYLMTFPDVDGESWYTEAVRWAASERIITGYDNGFFGVDDPVTREQIAAILWRYAGSPVVVAGPDFVDEADIASYAAYAVDWAQTNGIMGGVGDNRFAPRNNATRAQAAVILYQYLNGGDNSNEAPAPEEGPTVLMTTDISAEGMMAIYEALNWEPTGKVAVKLSTGEPPASNYLRPELIAGVVAEVDGTIVECNTAYGGSRASTAMHYQVAEDHGFTAIADFVILDENGSVALPVTGGTWLTENYVGAHFHDYDSYLILSHFKGHAMAGYGGAIKNISIGIGSSEGKNWIHTGGQSRTSWFGGEQNAFLESMGEAGKSVVDALDGKIVYINVMNRLSVDCDCSGNPAEPDMHDIGILASTDPVALDQACIDLVYSATDGQSLINRIEARNGLHTLEHAEEIGLGSRTYTLVNIDG